MTQRVSHLSKHKPKFLLDIPDHIIEKACAAYWNTGLYPGQLQWADIVQREDHRVPDIRLAIHAALSTAFTAFAAYMPLPIIHPTGDRECPS